MQRVPGHTQSDWPAEINDVSRKRNIFNERSGRKTDFDQNEGVYRQNSHH